MQTGAEPLSSGRRIVGRLAGRRDWWRADTGDVHRLAGELGWSTREFSGCDRWIGASWDGRSDVRINKVPVTGSSLRTLIEEVRSDIAAQGAAVARLPDQASVRRRFLDGDSSGGFVIEFDFGDFIVPVSLSDDGLRPARKAERRSIAAKIVDLAVSADRMRSELAEGDLLMRRTLEATGADPASGINPFWLRRRPWRVSDDEAGRLAGGWEIAALVLTEDLGWRLDGDGCVSGVADMHRFLDKLAADQPRRAAIRAQVDETGSAGLVSEVALQLVGWHGLDLQQVFTYLRASSAAGRGDGLSFTRGRTRETLFLKEGVMHAHLRFAEGTYSAGKLTLHGEYPPSLAIAAPGRALADYVDHPAFRATGVRVLDGLVGANGLELYHESRVLPIEQAISTPSIPEAKR